jgi:hypothetical protein
MEVAQLLSAAGFGGIVGSLLTTIVQAWLAGKQVTSNRNFSEKKDAYLGFLEAAHRSEIQQTLEASMNWGYWRNRCELVASPEVILLLQKVEDTNPIDGNSHPHRPHIIRQLKDAMRKDLGVFK